MLEGRRNSIASTQTHHDERDHQMEFGEFVNLFEVAAEDPSGQHGELSTHLITGSGLASAEVRRRESQRAPKRPCAGAGEDQMEVEQASMRRDCRSSEECRQ